MLSEEAVLGLNTATLAEPNALVLWEGQFGDFANGAQDYRPVYFIGRDQMVAHVRACSSVAAWL